MGLIGSPWSSHNPIPDSLTNALCNREALSTLIPWIVSSASTVE